MILMRETSAACSARGGSSTSRSTPSTRKRTTERASYGSKCTSDARSRSACSSSALIIRITGACAPLSRRSSAGGRSCISRARSRVAREVLDHLRDAAPSTLYARASSVGEALGVDGARQERPLQHALQLRDAFDGRIGPRQHDDAALLLALRQHAVRARERIRDPVRESVGGGGAGPWPSQGSTRSLRASRAAAAGSAPEAASACRPGSGGVGIGARRAGQRAFAAAAAAASWSPQKSRLGGACRSCSPLQVLVALRRDLASVGARAQHRRLDEDHQVRLLRAGARRSGTARRRSGCRRRAAPCRVPSVSWSWMRPPSTMICVSSTITVDSSARFDRIDAACRGRRIVDRATLPGRATRRIVPPSVICGLTRSTMPTSLRSNVWNGVHRRRAARRRVAAGDERNVLADDDARLLVVEREQRRRRQDVGADLRLERAREEREVGDRAEAGNRHRALHHAERQPLPDAAPGFDGDVDDVVAAAARREVGAADHARLRRVVARERLPLDAEFRRLVRRHLDDQRLDEHLRAAHVELLDDRAEVVVHRLGRHDDERVARRVGGDRRAVRGKRVAPAPARPRAAPSRTARSAPAPRHAERCRANSGGACDSVDPATRPAAVAAGQHRAQRLRDARGLGVLEVDDEHVAAGPARACRAARSAAARARGGRIVGAHQHAVRARIGHDRHALLGVDRPPVRPRRGSAQQPVQQRDDVERRRVAAAARGSAPRRAAGRATR